MYVRNSLLIIILYIIYIKSNLPITRDIETVGTAENVLKSRTMYGAFIYLKQCSWSWNCWANFESQEAKWCIQVLF